jgi:hypothetical protein
MQSALAALGRATPYQTKDLFYGPVEKAAAQSAPEKASGTGQENIFVHFRRFIRFIALRRLSV